MYMLEKELKSVYGSSISGQLFSNGLTARGVIGPPIMFENYESVKIDDGTFAAAPPHLK